MGRANRTVGFKPISKRRVKQFESEVTLEQMPEKERFEKAKRMAVKDFLANEMMMDEVTIDALPVERTFFPRFGDAKILYVQFANPQLRVLITSRSNYLQPNEEHPASTPKLVKYVPMELYQRFKALKEHAYKLRNNPSNPQSTNI